MDSARYGEPPPLPLRLHWLCEKYGDLPDDGGILDQDYRRMHEMQILSNIYAVVSRYINASGAAIHSLTESERRLLKCLGDEGLMFEEQFSV